MRALEGLSEGVQWQEGQTEVGRERPAPGKVSMTQRFYRSARGPEPAPGPAVDALGSSSGARLPDGARVRFEDSLGADLSEVRVHTGAGSAAAATELGARAFAVGRDIHFGAGEYRPDDPFGMHLLAHEVAHTVQQGGTSCGLQTKLEVSEPGDAAEVAADAFADHIVHGGPAPALGSAPAGVIHRVPGPGAASGGGVGAGEVAAVRSKLAAARALLADQKADLSPVERAQLQASVTGAENALREYDKLAGQGQSRANAMGGLVVAGGGILADDATVVGVADDPLLIVVGIGLLVTWLVTQPKATDVQLQRAWSSVISSLRTVAAAGEILIALKLNGDKIRGNTERLAEHLARLLALTAVGGVPSGEPPKNNNDNDKHWWKEIKAFLKNIKDGIGEASRKQAMRELQKRFSEEQILEIERQLAEAAKLMGEGPPSFLP